MKTKYNDTIERLIARHLTIKENLRELYTESDDIIEQLTSLMGVGDEHAYHLDGEVAVVVDNFKHKNSVFKTTCVKRYELQLEDELKFKKRREKRV